jgi:hypothetical protein
MPQTRIARTSEQPLNVFCKDRLLNPRRTISQQQKPWVGLCSGKNRGSGLCSEMMNKCWFGVDDPSEGLADELALTGAYFQSLATLGKLCTTRVVILNGVCGVLSDESRDSSLRSE